MLKTLGRLALLGAPTALAYPFVKYKYETHKATNNPPKDIRVQGEAALNKIPVREQSKATLQFFDKGYRITSSQYKYGEGLTKKTRTVIYGAINYEVVCDETGCDVALKCSM